MIVLSQIVAYLLIFLFGYVSLSLLLTQSTRPVFFRWEFFVIAFLLGVIEIGFLLFLLGWVWVPLSLLPVVWTLGLIWGVWLFFLFRTKAYPHYRNIPLSPLTRIQKWIIFILSTLVIFKCVLGFLDITSIPTYQDDSFANWNMRAQVFAERESLILDKADPEFLGMGYKQYPLTPYLLKTFLSFFAVSWSDTYINLPSFLFFLSSLVLIFFTVLRITEDRFLSCIGFYIGASLPLYFIHGTSPYFDVFQGTYFLLAILSVFLFLRKEVAWIIPAIFLGILGFTKSEWLIIYMTAGLASLAVFLFFSSEIQKQWKTYLKIFLGAIIVNLPFIIFKLSYGLGFGNGDASVWATKLSLHTEIFYPLYIALFQEGNYNLFPFFFSLIFIGALLTKKFRKNPFTGENIFLFAGILSFSMVLFVYLTTFTYQYVLDQTGINRSIVQLLPIFAVSFITLIHSLRHAR